MLDETDRLVDEHDFFEIGISFKQEFIRPFLIFDLLNLLFIL